MGKRCRLAAWGATFALIVAACAATETPETSSSDAPAPTATPSAPASTIPEAVTFPESLADASFLQAALPDQQCAAGDASQLALFDPATGERLWSFALPRPGVASVVDSTGVYSSFLWDRGQHPGIAALDLTSRAPRWQRFLSNEVEQMVRFNDRLIVVTSDDVRAIDTATGEDIWVAESQFDFSDVALGESAAFTLDSVGVHAIDFNSGRELWELEIDRADTIAVDDQTLAVAAGTRLVGVDVNERTRLFDLDVTRLGAGELFVNGSTVAFELAPSVAPGGGIAVLDRDTGFELWKSTSTGSLIWADGSLLISSTANDEPRPAAPFVLIARDVTTGEERWRTTSTAQASSAVLGTGNNQVVVVDPHPAVAGLQRVRLLDATLGEPVWETSSTDTYDSAVVTPGAEVTLFGSSTQIGPDRGTVAQTNGSTTAWVAQLPDGIAQPPSITPQGILVISGERAPVCIGRRVGEPAEPAPESAVLGESLER